MRYLIKFSYDGSNYIGFQKQKGKETIQGKLEDALTKINNGKETTITATGRTDKGVHALAQYGHADIDVNINEKKLKRAMNSFLPDDIHVIKTMVVPNDFHTRYDVKEKVYVYKINLGEYNPIERNYVFQYNYQLDVEKIKESIKCFEGEHDFRAFATDNKDKENCTRIISKTNVNLDNNILSITFQGNGFLRYQVRNMVGILIKIGEGKLSKEQLIDIINSKDRTKSGKTAPAVGLYLQQVYFNSVNMDEI